MTSESERGLLPDMPYVARRSIRELAALYELEPGIRDVFVEGSDDASVIGWYLRHRCTCDVCVVEIGAIDVPSSLIEACNVDVGNRGRVLALAEELNKQLRGDARKCPTLVCDADSDRVFGWNRAVEMLLATDFACLEMYLFNRATLDKMISLVMMGCDVSADQALKSLGRVLVRLWVIKTANHRLGLSMSWISFERCCQLSGTAIEFNESEFVKRYLTANSRHKEQDTFSREMREIESHLQDDPRHQMNGHHFFVLARWFFRHFAKEKKVLANDKAFERACFACLELDALDTQSLFQQLVNRIAA